MCKLPTQAQLLKAYGHAQRVELKDLRDHGDFLQEPSELATSVLVGRFCEHPDAYDPEIAAHDDPIKLAFQLGMSFHQCEGLIESHRRMGAYNNEKWKSCAPGVDGPACTYLLDRDTFPNHYTRTVTEDELLGIVKAGVWGLDREEAMDRHSGRPMLDVAYDFINLAYARVGVTHVEVEGDPHNVHISAVGLPGSTIGRAWYTNGQCSDHVNQHIDSTYHPGLQGMMKLGCHEFGHNHGEQHQFSGQNTHQSVMSYSPPKLFYGFSTGKEPHVLPRDRSIDSLIEKYGGPLDPPIPTAKLKIIDGDVFVSAFGYLARMELKGVSIVPNVTDKVAIVDGNIEVEIDGKRLKLQIIERADF